LKLLLPAALIGLLTAGLAWDGLTDLVGRLTMASLGRTEILSLFAMAGILAAGGYLVRALFGFTRFANFSRAERLVLRDLPRAIARGEIQPFFQPIVDSATGRVVAVEALARWIREDGSELSPSVFIALSERAGMVRRITARIAEQAILTAALWRRDDLSLPISINLAVEDLEAEDLVEHLLGLCRRFDVPPAQIRLELTESQSIAHFGVIQRAVSTLQAAGMTVFLDDFGTGYASLSVLQQISFTGIKLDQTFVRTLMGDSRADAIVRASIGMARELGLAMVAEGVEDEPTADRLRALGIQRMQGFLYARPMPAQSIVAFCRDRALNRGPERHMLELGAASTI
jgi:EAL domain-containing protein (putative c-di-GMP-specific phosphodiesterase class I)